MGKNKNKKNRNQYIENKKEREEKVMLFEEEKEFPEEYKKEEPVIEETEELQKANSNIDNSVDIEPYKPAVFKEEPVEENSTSKITKCRLNVRSEKDKNSRILRVLEMGEVIFGKESGEWFELDDEGYVMSEFLK